MLLVKTTVKSSKIHGLGVFAAEPIGKGTAIWAFDPVLDRVLKVGELAGYPDHVVEFLEHYCEYFPETDELVLSGDNDRYTNHSSLPNSVVDGQNAPTASVIAARDIRKGEEITCDYAVIRSRKWAKLAVPA